LLLLISPDAVIVESLHLFISLLFLFPEKILAVEKNVLSVTGNIVAGLQPKRKK
jgi:hypothetical protein